MIFLFINVMLFIENVREVDTNRKVDTKVKNTKNRRRKERDPNLIVQIHLPSIYLRLS